MALLSDFVNGSSSSSIDVFVSYRPNDTRYGFTDHLRKALLDSNISTFVDDEDIETGEFLKPELVGAIKASRASIIVFSNNYADSAWCLDELVLILEQQRESNQLVIPIFYHVEPRHIRHQTGTIAVAMTKHIKYMEAEKDAEKKRVLAQRLNGWIEALSAVASLAGIRWECSDRLESEFIKEVVEYICRRLHIPKWSVLPQLIGMDDSIKYVTSWLKDRSSDILAISGMGGIGKTSLARYVYGLHSYDFDTSSFIGDIGTRCGAKVNRLLSLQKQLYDDISETSSIENHEVSIYTSMIENAVAYKKVLVVLDDIDSHSQVDALLGSKGFLRGSKVIITTRDSSLINRCALFKMGVKPIQLMLQCLDDVDSQHLLCSHAFKSTDDKASYKEVVKMLVKYCQGHPLALTVFGKYLRNKSVDYWKDYIQGLKKENDFDINRVLRRDFDSLPSDNDKELFKHIACFFAGMDRDIVETILKACGINTVSGIENLTDRCLVSIGWNNELQMHHLLQQMGRSVVSQESEKSLFWCHEESFNVLKRQRGTEKVLGLSLDMKMLENKKLQKIFELKLDASKWLEVKKLQKRFELKTDALSNMDNLMLLKLNNMQMINGSYENFPKKVRWLCMHGFPLKSIPLDFPMENLVALDMSYSSIEFFCVFPRKTELIGSSNGKKLLGSLKILNLSFCEKLCRLGGFRELPALERLIVRKCTGLEKICDSVESCVELVLIDLSYCNKLEVMPRSIALLQKVETLSLDGCNRILIEDWLLSIRLPKSLVRLSLRDNNLSTKSFRMNFARLFMLEELYLDGNPITSMPIWVKSLPRLEICSMSNLLK